MKSLLGMRSRSESFTSFLYAPWSVTLISCEVERRSLIWARLLSVSSRSRKWLLPVPRGRYLGLTREASETRSVLDDQPKKLLLSGLPPIYRGPTVMGKEYSSLPAV